MKKLSFVGPRLAKDGPIGYFGETNKNPIQIKILKVIEQTIKDCSSEYVLYTSLQGGIETWAVQAAIRHKMPFVVQLPYNGQESIYSQRSKDEYYALIDAADAVEKFNQDQSFSIEAVKERDARLLECDLVYSFYSPDTKLIKEAEARKVLIMRPLEDEVPQAKETGEAGTNYWIEL